MTLEAASFPFAMTDPRNGFREAKGLARLEPEAVVLEFRETFFGTFRGSIKEVTIPLAEISSLEYHQSWVGARVTIFCRRTKYLQALPGTEQGKVVLGVVRADRSQAKEFEIAYNLWAAERALSAARRPEDDGTLPE